jgi:hypothetical protein
VRKVDLRLDFVALRADCSGGLGRSVHIPTRTEVCFDFFGLMVFERAGMRLLFRDTQLRKRVSYRFAFDFQLSGQIVDSNLAHPPLFPPG